MSDMLIWTCEALRDNDENGMLFGVFSTLEKAKDYAQQKLPGVHIEWDIDDDLGRSVPSCSAHIDHKYFHFIWIYPEPIDPPVDKREKSAKGLELWKQSQEAVE